jgi:hypothetical protein
MPIIQNSVYRVNRVLVNVLDKPLVARALSPFQPIANTLTSRYLDYAMPGDCPPASPPVAYTIIDADGNTRWSGDTAELAENPEHRHSNSR